MLSLCLVEATMHRFYFNKLHMKRFYFIFLFCLFRLTTPRDPQKSVCWKCFVPRFLYGRMQIIFLRSYMHISALSTIVNLGRVISLLRKIFYMFIYIGTWFIDKLQQSEQRNIKPFSFLQILQWSTPAL